jgi:hypothetical protein
MLTGTLPFRGENAMDLIVQQLNAPPPQAIKLAPKTPPSLSRMIVKMMAKSPDDRPSLQDVRQLFAELRDTTVPPRAKRETEARLRRESETRKREAAARAKRGEANDEEIFEERQEPSMGKARLSLAEMEGQDGRPPPEHKSRAGLLVGILLLAAACAGLFFALNKKDDSDTTVAAAGGSGSAAPGAGSGSAIVAGSAATGSAGSATPTIEFEEDKVARSGSAASGTAGASGGSARRAQREADDKATEELMGAEPAVVDKPGKLIIMLQHPSTIEIDGKAVAQASKGGSFNVTPGEHSIRIRAADRDTVNRTVSVEPGGSAVIRIVDDTGDSPPTPTPTPTPPPPPPAGETPTTP